MSGKSFALRPYQQDAFDSIERGYDEYRKLLTVIPTGGGKTILFAAIAAARKRTLVLAHREELLDQAAEKIRLSTGLIAEVEKADRYASPDAAVVVASVQTLARAARRERWWYEHFDQIVVDEAHHATAESYRSILNYFEGRLLGVTATPNRGDRKSLGSIFEHLAYEISLKELIAQGFLSPIKVKTLPVAVDLEGVSKRAGDVSADEAGSRLAPYLEQLADAIAVEIMERKTVVFLPLVSLAATFSKLLMERGINATYVSGETTNRKEILEWFASAPRGSALCNAMLLTEGWDQPDVDCVVPLRVTTIDALYAQMVGRGTRLSPETGKTHCLVLDALWVSTKLRLSRPSRLIASSDDEAREIDERLAAMAAAKMAGATTVVGPEEEGDDLMGAASDVAEARAQKLAKQAKENAHRASKTFDPTDFCAAIGDEEGTAYEPNPGKESRPPTKGQLAALEKAGFNTDVIKTFGHASRMMDNLIKRREADLATPKQLRMLIRFGIPDAAKISFKEASAIIDARFGRRAA